MNSIKDLFSATALLALPFSEGSLLPETTGRWAGRKPRFVGPTDQHSISAIRKRRARNKAGRKMRKYNSLKQRGKA